MYKTDLLENALNSNTEVELTHRIDIDTTIIPVSTIGARIPIERLFSTEDLMAVKRKTAIIVPEHLQQNLKCFPQAFVIGKRLAETGYNRKKTVSSLFRNNGKLLEYETDTLIKKVFNSMDNYDKKNGGSIIDDMYKFHKTCTDYSVYIFDDVFKCEKIAYSIESRRVTNKKKIFLFLITQGDIHHIICLYNVKGFFGRKYFCSTCNMPHNSENHICIYRCNKCNHGKPCKKRKRKGEITCDKCLRVFPNRHCFNRHNNIQPKLGGNICTLFYICPVCCKFVDTTVLQKKGIDTHKCSLMYCQLCSQYYENDSSNIHFCSIRRYTTRVCTKLVSYYYYDIETSNTSQLHDESEQKYMHEPILLVCHQVCHLCLTKTDDSYVCRNCVKRKHIFRGSDCIEQFLTLIEKHLPFLGIGKKICIGHNSRSFDVHFLLAQIMKRRNGKTTGIKLTSNGNKVLLLSYSNISFIDSFSFLAMGLRKFPSVFNLPVRKTFFPFLFFNDPKNAG